MCSSSGRQNCIVYTILLITRWTNLVHESYMLRSDSYIIIYLHPNVYINLSFTKMNTILVLLNSFYPSQRNYRGADKSLARPGRKEADVSFTISVNFLRRLALQGKKNLMTARVSMLLKLRASLTCFRACFLPGRAKDL